jgi:hypothetical protein
MALTRINPPLLSILTHWVRDISFPSSCSDIGLGEQGQKSGRSIYLITHGSNFGERYRRWSPARVDNSEVAQASDSDDDRIDREYGLIDFRHWFVGHTKKYPRPELLNFGLAL